MERNLLSVGDRLKESIEEKAATHGDQVCSPSESYTLVDL